MKTTMILAAPLLVGVCLCVGAADEPKKPAQGAPPPAKSAPAAKGAHPESEKAIRAQVEAFTRAFNAGDAKAVAALFTDDAQITDPDGALTEGRAAVAEVFASSFKATPGAKIEITTDSLRFLGPDVAIEEGRARVSPAAGGTPESTRYTVIYVKQDGQWLQSSVREHPDKDVSHHDRLKDLEWMLGEWVDESDAAVVFTNCEWSPDKNFLLRAFTVHVQGKPAMTGTQRIGWDPRQKQIRSWVFDSEGGFGEGHWSQDGDRWIVKSTGVLRDGQTATATYVITPLNKHMMRWKAVDRTVGGQAAPDIDEFVMVHKPPKPQSR